MSLSQLVNGADCGPSNGLSALGKRFGQDRSLHQDRFDGSNGGGGSGSSTPGGGGSYAPGAGGMRTAQAPPGQGMQGSAGLLPRGPAHGPGGGGAAFDMAPLRDQLPMPVPMSMSMHPQRPLPSAAFEAAFASGSQSQRQQGLTSAAAPAAPAWAADFMQQSTSGVGAASSTARTGLTAGAPKFMQARQMVSDQHQHQHAHAHLVGQQQSLYAPSPSMQMHLQQQQQPMHLQQQGALYQQQPLPQQLPQQQKNSAQSDAQWASAFSAVLASEKSQSQRLSQPSTSSFSSTFNPQHQQPLQPLQQQQPQQAHAENTPADADALAAAAGKLIATVSHDRSDKFRRSGFLALMRKLRDREAGIQGTDIVDTAPGAGGAAGAAAGAVAEGAAMQQQDKGKGKGRAMDAVDDAQMMDSELTRGVLDEALRSSSSLSSSTAAPQSAQEAYWASEALARSRARLRDAMLQEPSSGGMSAAEEAAARAEMADMWAEQDAASEALEARRLAEARERAERERQEQQGRQAFVGDGGDVEAREREDLFARLEFEDRERERERAQRAMAGIADGARAQMQQQQHQQRQGQQDDADAAEVARYRSLGVNVPGASPAWQEASDEQAQQDAEAERERTASDDDDFVGRGWFGPKGRGFRGAQNNEWDRLQADWDAWDATATGLQQQQQQQRDAAAATTTAGASAAAAASQTGAATYHLRPAPPYQFHRENPYLRAETRHHAQHAGASAAAVAPALDSLLASEARVQADASDAGAWFDLGVKQQENEREGQAIAALRRAIELDGSLREAWLALAVSYTNENDRAQAFEAIEQWIQSSVQYKQVVAQHRAAGGLPQAVSSSSSSSSSQSMTPIQRHRVLTDTLIALARHGNTAGAEVDADVQIALGVLFNASEEYDKAVDCFATALSVRPDDWLLYNRLGATLSNSGRSAEAIQYYHHALNLQPGFVRCHFNLSISCLNLKMYQDAAEHIYSALSIQASQSEQLDAGNKEVVGVGSASLWETFRVSLELMDRPDLADLCAKRDVSLFDPADLKPHGSAGGSQMEH